VEFTDVVRSRRMHRSFERTPLPSSLVDQVLDAGRWAPSAGNSQGWAFVVLEGPEQTGRFWDITLPLARRASFRWQRLLDAPVIVLPLADRESYLARYREPDKAASGLGEAERWPVPYWQVDTAFATMSILLAATDAGLGALFFGVFQRSDQLLASLGVPPGNDLIGAIAMGYPVVESDEPGRSSSRPRRTDVIHRGGWQSSVTRL
jgi:nitroreductase